MFPPWKVAKLQLWSTFSPKSARDVLLVKDNMMLEQYGVGKSSAMWTKCNFFFCISVLAFSVTMTLDIFFPNISYLSLQEHAGLLITADFPILIQHSVILGS